MVSALAADSQNRIFAFQRKEPPVIIFDRDGNLYVTDIPYGRVFQVSKNGELHPVQEAMVKRHGSQCGFCTPGILCSAAALLAQTSSPTRNEIQEALAGNLCRCTGYAKIYDAVETAGRRLSVSKEGKG